VSDVWSSRAEAYRTSPTHAADADLEIATGGGHVARRLREGGAQVVTADPAPGMKADVMCFAEDIPFEDGSFDVVVTRIAPHHFADIGRAVRELARVSNRLVVVEDTLYSSPDVEAAEKLRDPTHVRNLSETEWRAALEDAGLEVDHVEHFRKTHSIDDWLARTECTGADAERVRELLADVTDDDGSTWHDTKIILRGVKGAT
jgi:SAM-dependent methyltransferase